MSKCIKPADIPDLIREGRNASMLFGPTQAKNIVFNIASTLFRVPITTAAAVSEQTLGRAAAALEHQPFKQQQFLSEAMAQVYGFFHSLTPALRTYGRQLKNSRDILLQSAFERTAARAPGTAESAALGAVSKVTSVPFRGLQWVDNFFFDFNYGSQMWRYAYRRAKQEGYRGFNSALGRAEGILLEQEQKIGALSARVNAETAGKLARAGITDPAIIQAKVAAELRRRANPRGAAYEPLLTELKTPLQLAERTIFINREGKMLDQALSLLERADAGLGRFISVIAPFRRTPANEAREFLRSTPLGLATAGKKYADALAVGLPPELARASIHEDVGQAIVGTMALASIALAIKGGVVKVTPFYTGKSKALRTTEEAAGQSQESITIGKHNIPVRNLGSLGQAILTTEKAMREHDAWKEANPGGTSYPERVAFWARQATLGTLLGVADQQFLQNLSELHEAWNNPEKSLPQFAQRFGASFVPSAVRAVVRAGQPVVPVPEEEAKQGLIHNILAGARQSLVPTGPEKLGLFGETVTRPSGVAGAVAGARETTEDPLVQRMMQVGAVHVAPATDIQLQIRGKKTRFSEVYSPEDAVTFGQAKGALQRFYMQAALRSAGFDRMPPEAQKLLLDSAFERAGRVVDGRMRQFSQYGKRPNFRDLLRGLLPAVR